MLKHVFRARLCCGLIFMTCACSAVAALPTQDSPAINADDAYVLRAASLKAYLNDRARLERITYTLLRAASVYCPEAQTYSLGAPPLSTSDLPENLRAAFEETIGDARDPSARFFYTLPNSPAAKAGVRPGDKLLSITDTSDNKPLAAKWNLPRGKQTLGLNYPLNIRVGRLETERILSASSEIICKLEPRLQISSTPAFVTTATQLTVSTGLLHELPSDNELALVLAQGVAHWLLENYAHQAPDEEQADYLATYIAHSVKVPSGLAASAWSRLALNPSSSLPEGILNMHPSPMRHASAIRKAETEILALEHAGTPPLPPSRFLTKALHITGFELPASATASPSLAEDPRLYDLNAPPLRNIDNVGLAGYQRFLDTPIRPRAFAIGISTDNNRTSIWQFQFGINAASRALSSCKSRNQGHDCVLYAVDDQIVWNPEHQGLDPSPATLQTADLQLPPASGYARIDDTNAVPLTPGEIQMYRAFLEKPAPRAFVIDSRGKGRYWVGTSSLESALAYCEKNRDDCWLYAVNDIVVWQKDPALRLSRLAQLTPTAGEQDFLSR